MRIINSDLNGFTVVELLVTLVVAGLFILSLNTMYTTQIYISQNGRDISTINSFVEGKVEELRSQGFLNTSIGNSDISNELPNAINQPRSAILSVSELNPATKKVVITINYNEQGKSQTYKYATLIGELGVGQY